ncbi:MAG TPA: class I SAM-dependent methyltransferase [Candidatus Eisenbacteria bacterium]|nr:class I SAM-dependent methyltransferase [Candidatus Eisenbacteria bacterium]
MWGVARHLYRGHQAVFLDYPVHPSPRYGYGRPAHEKLDTLIGAGKDRYAGELEACLAFRPWLDRIEVSEPPGSSRPAWINGFFPGGDSATLYSLVARRNARRYLEVGSGNSTKFVRRAIEDHGLRTCIESVDPEPRADVQAIADVLTRQPLERVDLSMFHTLEAGDILFIDSSHRCFMNSDVTVAFLEILPSLADGVLVHFHDICLPYDYPPGTEGEYYSEQYVLAAYLLGGSRRAEIVLPNAYISGHPELRTILDPLWSTPGRDAVERHGSSFWMEMTGERGR